MEFLVLCAFVAAFLLLLIAAYGVVRVVEWAWGIEERR